jgi:FHS family L-fucose permease-like MFS transporter
VGAQVAVANFCEEAGKDASTACKNSLHCLFCTRNENQVAGVFAAAQGLYAFNRFLTGGIMTFKSVKPRYIHATYLFMCFVFVLAASQSTGNASIAMLCLVFCWESACFATIFTLGLRGLGRHTKIGGSLIVAAISGGAAFLPITGAVATHLQNNGSKKPFHMAMLIPMAEYICAWVYPLYFNLFNRETMDVHRETEVGIMPVQNEKELSLQDSHVAQKQQNVPDVCFCWRGGLDTAEKGYTSIALLMEKTVILSVVLVTVQRSPNAEVGRPTLCHS